VWRRTRPLSTLVVAIGAIALRVGYGWTTGRLSPEIDTSVFVLFLLYALFRWGAGREIIVGTPLPLTFALACLVQRQVPAGEAVAGVSTLLATAALGTTFRYRAHARSHEMEEVKLRERERLARDLHDTVAHHVSAIVIRAQAGLAVSTVRPEAAAEALRVIQAEAGRALAEMRSMVRVLRRDEAPDLAPTPRAADLARLAHDHQVGPPVSVELDGDLDDLAPPVSAAVYRMAQESVTNARRHARHATGIQVRVDARDDSVRLRVRDDGDASHGASPGVGYGLAGMRERAHLLGGSCHAGPDPERGWTVTAVLPRMGPAA
jgi:signal transduction histidine kinase